MTEKFTTVEAYLQSCTGETRKRLDIIRKAVHKLAPDVEERISYNIPGFFKGKKVVIYMAGYAHHTSIYPGRVASPEYIELAREYVSGQSTLKFPNDKPLPTDLVDEFIRLRLQELG